MSRKSAKSNCLSEKISSLINAKPSLIESDDEDITTIDKIGENHNDSDFSVDELEIANYRKINSTLLDEEDSKYSGKGISRKDVSAFNNDLSGSEDFQSDEYNSSPEEESNVESEESENDSESKNEDYISNQEKITNYSKKESNINEGLLAKVGSDAEKGIAIKNQLLIWDFLLDYRLKFQKCLNASNQFPNFENFNKFRSQGGSNFEEALEKSQKSLKHLLSSLISLQQTLLKSNKEYLSSLDSTVQIKSSGTTKNKNQDTEDNKSRLIEGKAKLKNLEDFSTKISKSHLQFENYKNNVIQKWNDRTRLGYISHKNFSAFEQSTLKQIEHVLLDKQRLISRTQTKRSSYHILGCNDEEPPPKKQANLGNVESENLGSKNKPVLIKEIFDDDDFYHQLLSELVRRKANDITDPVQLGKQWTQLQKIRSKIKKAVDTKASKGRKVRYVVHPKLVNFMMPINELWYTENSRTELLNSLFGKKVH